MPARVPEKGLWKTMKTNHLLGCLIVPLAVLMGCGGGGEAVRPAIPSPVAPVQVAACLTFALDDDRPPGEDAYARRIRSDIRYAVEQQLVRAGFTVVANQTYPHDLVAKLSTEPGSAVATGAEVRSTLLLEADAGRVVELEGRAVQATRDYAQQVAKRLIDAMFSAPEVGAFARDIRRPDVERMSARLRSEHDAAVAEALLPPPAAPVAPAAPCPTEPKPAEAPFAHGATRADAYALVVGVERYRSGKRALGAKTDAERFAKMARESLGVPEKQVFLAIDDHAKKADIEAVVSWMKLQVPRGARIYFYFSGLGAAERGHPTALLLPQDADAKALDTTAMRLTSLLRDLTDTRAKEVVAFVDAGMSGMGPRSLSLSENDTPVKARDEDSPPRVLLITATGAGETAGTHEGEPEGLLTHYLIEGLGHGFADVDADGQVSLAELYAWTRPRVQRQARRQSFDQSPVLLPGADTTPVSRVFLTSDLAGP